MDPGVLGSSLDQILDGREGEPQAAWPTRPNEGISAAQNFSTPFALPVGIPHSSLKRGRRTDGRPDLHIRGRRSEDGCMRCLLAAANALTSSPPFPSILTFSRSPLSSSFVVFREIACVNVSLFELSFPPHIARQPRRNLES